MQSSNTDVPLLLSWCSPDTSLGARPLLATLESLGSELTLIPCRGLLDKIWSLRKALVDVPLDRVVCSVDGYDTLFLRNPAELRKLYEKFGERVLFSAQKSREHHFPHLQAQVSDDEEEHWLNSGVIVGRCSEIRWMLDAISGWNFQALETEFNLSQGTIGRFNDQTVFGSFAMLYPDRIAVDANCLISRTSAYETVGMADSALTKSTWLNQNGEAPCIFHLPFTHKGVYARYLEMVEFLVGRLAPWQVDLERLSSVGLAADDYGSLARRLLDGYRLCRNFRIVFLRQMISTKVSRFRSKLRRRWSQFSPRHLGIC